MLNMNHKEMAINIFTLYIYSLSLFLSVLAQAQELLEELSRSASLYSFKKCTLFFLPVPSLILCPWCCPIDRYILNNLLKLLQLFYHNWTISMSRYVRLVLSVKSGIYPANLGLCFSAPPLSRLRLEQHG
jgi:hypothetical protein